MIINGVYFANELSSILDELQSQLHINGINLLTKTRQLPNDIMITCPYHKEGQERKPSAGIRRDDGYFHCFTCGETHSLPEVVSYCFGKQDMGVFGWNWLLKNFLTISVEDRKHIKLNITREKQVAKINYVSEDELEKYRYYHEYMWKRKLTPEIIELFDIGYDMNTECLTFPNKDKYGNTLFIARRSVNVKYFNYPSSVEKPLYGFYEYILTKNNHYLLSQDYDFNKVLVCESMLDALTAWVYGKCAVALNGLGTESQIKQIEMLPCRNIILATDNDRAGYRAREWLKRKIKNKIVTQYIFPDRIKDINDMTVEQFNNLAEIF